MAVLGDQYISARFDSIFKEGTADRRSIRAAKYYLRLGDRFLILPNGRRYFGEEGPARCRPFALEPGQTALVSTKERLVMPQGLSGIVGPVFDLTDNGILFFGGMLVDPGFGMRRTEDDEGWEKDHEPLSFYLANVGSEPIELRPGRDPVASIAFLEVDNEPALDWKEPDWEKFDKRFKTTTAREAREELFDTRRSDGPDRALGLVEDISKIRDRVDKFEASTQQVVLFGVVVLAITLFASIVNLVIAEPKRVDVASMNLDDVTESIGFAVGFLAVLVIVFYVSVSAVVKARGLPWRRRRAG